MPLRNWFIGLAVLLAIVVVLSVAWFGLQTMTMQASRTRADQLPGIPVGGQVSVVGQIKSVQGNMVTFEVLQGKDYDQRSGALVQAERGADRIAMGTEPDVKVGGIAQFEGKKTGIDRLKLERIVILTGFVKGPGGP